MRFPCTISQHNSGWQARHVSQAVGEIAVRADSREAALEKLRGEIRYRLELCPCSGESYRHIEVVIVDGPAVRSA